MFNCLIFNYKFFIFLKFSHKYYLLFLCWVLKMFALFLPKYHKLLLILFFFFHIIWFFSQFCTILNFRRYIQFLWSIILFNTIIHIHSCLYICICICVCIDGCVFTSIFWIRVIPQIYYDHCMNTSEKLKIWFKDFYSVEIYIGPGGHHCRIINWAF